MKMIKPEYTTSQSLGSNNAPLLLMCLSLISEIIQKILFFFSMRPALKPG